jgi:hypothetical protein
MIRTLAAAAALATLALAGAASAQTWGQPVYLNAYGGPVGGTPLSEIETRSYVQTGRWADGYSERPQVYVPVPGYGRGRGHGYGHDRGHSRYSPPSRSGYRDEWGYNDDRPASARGRSNDRRAHRHDRNCGCSDVYLYDR